MYCKKCGSYLEEGQAVCIKCGARQDVNGDMINMGRRSGDPMTSGSSKSWFHSPAANGMGDGDGGRPASHGMDGGRPPVPDYNRADSNRSYSPGPGIPGESAARMPGGAAPNYYPGPDYNRNPNEARGYGGYAGPGLGPAPKKRPAFLIPLIAGGSAVLAITIVVIVLFATGIIGGGSAEDVAVNAMKCKYSNKVDGYMKNIPEGIYKFYGGKKQAREIFSQRLKRIAEEVKEECGDNYKVDCSVVKTEDISKEELENDHVNEFSSVMGWSSGSIKEGKYVYVEVNATGSAGEYNETQTCVVVKHNGKWYLIEVD